ncbi:MAG: hypothetical protein CL484_06640 [Acidobacteria bacterium]|nr:hypothetical protein [Acidobacteriota bacterium]
MADLITRFVIQQLLLSSEILSRWGHCFFNFPCDPETTKIHHPVGLPFYLVALECQAGLSEKPGNSNLEPTATGRRSFPPPWRLGLEVDGTPGRKGGQLAGPEFAGWAYDSTIGHCW